LVHAFARAYREIDDDAMAVVLAPAARVRVLMPLGLLERQGPDQLIGVLREFAAKWTIVGAADLEITLLEPNMLRTGRLAAIGHRYRLRSADGERGARMVVQHIVAIAEGRIALVDELCSGVMPDAT
jgi:hypothetical protein